MFNNVGDVYVQTKKLDLSGLVLDEVGAQFTIQDYHSVPHGYASIKHNNVLLFIPDDVFLDHFVLLNIYNKYYRLGDQIMLNANGNLRTYSIERIEGNSHYVTINLEAVD